MAKLADLSVEQLAPELAVYLDAPRWLVAYSGGVDSHVLLHILLQIPNHPPITAIHINHQLQAEASQWAEHCRQQATALAAAIRVQAVDVQQQAGDSLEQQARNARYRLFELLVGRGEVLMMGHHLDDQAETVLMRLLRGSGSRGLAGMPVSRPLGSGQLHRPLLGFSRQSIEQYARNHQLQWIEDPSNRNIDFDRNFLRQQLFPQLAERWPGYRQTLSRAVSHQLETAQLNDELAVVDFTGLGCPSDSRILPITKLQTLSAIRQKNLLRYWFVQMGFDTPSAAQLDTLMKEVMDAREDAEPVIRWPALELRRFNRQLYAMQPLASFDNQRCFDWNLKQSLHLAEGNSLMIRSDTGSAIVKEKLAKQSIKVRFRQGGERCQPAGRAHSQSLKKLLQEYRVPPWLRDRVPLVCAGDEIIAVADLWVCEGWQVEEGEQGIRLHWQN